MAEPPVKSPEVQESTPFDLFTEAVSVPNEEVMDLFAQEASSQTANFDLFGDVTAVSGTVPLTSDHANQINQEPSTQVTGSTIAQEQQQSAPRLRFADLERMMTTHNTIVKEYIEKKTDQAITAARQENTILQEAKQQGRVFYVKHEIVINGKKHVCMIPMISDQNGTRMAPGYKDTIGGTIFSGTPLSEPSEQPQNGISPESSSATLPIDTLLRSDSETQPAQVMNMAQFTAAFGQAAAAQIRSFECADGCGGTGHSSLGANSSPMYGDVPEYASIMRFFGKKKDKHNHLHACPRCKTPGHYEAGSTCKKCHLKIPKLAKAA